MKTALFLILALSSALQAEELVIYRESGEAFALQADFSDILNLFAKSSRKSARDYLTLPSDQDKQDIAYIVNTMGMSSLAKIAKAKSSLKSAGDRIQHVHPLQFLLVVFSNEKTKASMQALYGRSWVWDEFFSGIKKSLNEESERDNMKVEFVHDFTSKLNISFNAVYPLIQERRWETLVKTLIALLPRNGNADRYDM